MKTIDPGQDRILGALSTLPMHEPDRQHAARIRARSHDRLRRGSRRDRWMPLAAGAAWHRTVEPTLVAVGCAVYLLEVVRIALRLHGS